MRTRTRTGVLVVATLVVVGLCATAVSAQVDNRPKSVKRIESSPSCVKLGPDGQVTAGNTPTRSTNELTNLSQAAVVATTEAIETPRYNSRDGKPWCDPRDQSLRVSDDVIPVEAQIRSVKIRVNEVIFDSPELRVVEGESILLTVPGPAPVQSKTTTEAGDINLNQYNRVPDIGSASIFLLHHETVPFTDGDRDTIALIDNGQGQWVLQGSDKAQSHLPGRSTGKAALISKLKSERSAGLNPNRVQPDRLSFDPLQQ